MYPQQPTTSHASSLAGLCPPPPAARGLTFFDITTLGVLMCSSPGDFEHLFMCLLATCVSSLEKCLCKPLARYGNGSLIFVAL